MAAGTLETLASLVGRALEPLEGALAPDNVIAYFEQLGTRFPESFATNAAIRVRLDGASGLAGGFGPLLTSLSDAELAGDTAAIVAAGGQLLGGIGSLLGALDGLVAEIEARAGSFPPLSEADVLNFTGGLTTRILNDSILRQLELNRPEFASAAILLGVVDRFAVPVAGADPLEPPVFSRGLQLGLLINALSDAEGHFRSLLGWGDTPFDPARALARIQAFQNLFTYNTVIDTSGGTPVLESTLVSVRGNPATAPPGLDLTVHFPIPDGFAFTAPAGPGFAVSLSSSGGLPAGATLTATPPSKLSLATATTISFQSELSRTPISPDTAIVLLGQTGGTSLQADAISLSVGFSLTANPATGSASGDVFTRLALVGGRAIIDLSGGDGFLSSLLPSKRVESEFELAARYGIHSGLTFEAGGILEIEIPLHVSVGGVAIDGLNLSLPIGRPGRSGVPFDIATSVSAAFGPFTLVVDAVGLELDLVLGSGRLGVGDVDLGFKFPTGIGLSLDGAGVSGGGFLSFDRDRGRYFGSADLQVFGVAVKAFGLIETRFPDGRDGFSLVVVISAEFTPVQLGFGFTLNGVGGLLGVNRGFFAEALGEAIRSGSVAHLLFPRDPVRDAPAILNDLETIFPASPGHHVFGPMAKLGWGTPTLITADLGVVIEFPGPRLAVVGIAQTALPTRQFGLVRLNLAIGGVLDFPKRTFSLDASLFDSVVGSFPVSGDAAFRLSFGDRPNFALSIGGFNPSFKPPANFPKLQRVSVDLGVNGNPSLTLQGYLALTSNTAQIGAAISLRASGAGIRLTGHLSFDALFVFSPFSFEAAIDAGVRVSFHGVGLGVHLHGHLSGPTPWRVRGEVCVSVLWWDACLGFDASFGKKTRAELPAIDPWDPQGLDPELPIIGLRAATTDVRNWSGSPPPSALSVVSLAETVTDAPPIDPMGAATFRQKVVPLSQKITKFGAFKPIENDQFTRSSVSVGSTTVPETEIVPIKDQFAPAQFKEMKAAERLSAPAYEELEAGFTIDPELLRVGPIAPKVITYHTELLDGNRQPVGNEGDFTLTQRHLRGMLARSAAGIRRTGALRYVTANMPVKVRLPGEDFEIADRCAFTRNDDLTGPTTYAQASLALEDHLAAHPEDIGRFAVVPHWELPV